MKIFKHVYKLNLYNNWELNFSQIYTKIESWTSLVSVKELKYNKPHFYPLQDNAKPIFVVVICQAYSKCQLLVSLVG